MSKKNTAKAQRVIACTCRVANYGWIKDRKLYNLPLPVAVGTAAAPHAGGTRSRASADHGYAAVTHLIVYAQDLPALAYAAKYVRDVDVAWLAANGYSRAVAPRPPHADRYALFELGAEATEAELLNNAHSNIYVCSTRWSGSIDADFFSRPLPKCDGRSVPNIFERIRPFLGKWHAAKAYNPAQIDLNAMTVGEGVVVGDEDFIKSRILTVREVQVMLDGDLAMMYGVETKVLNQAVKRNIGRFPPDFMFQLTKAEWLELQSSCGNLKSQFVTSSWGGARKLPYVFTENGIAMLSGVLRSQTAIDVNIRIMRVFVAIRRFAIANLSVLQRLGAVEVKQAVMDEKLNAVLGKIECKEFPPEKIFYDGHEYDAYDKIVEFIRKAKSDIVIIDAYADNVVLQILEKKLPGVGVTIVKGPRARLTALDVSKFNAQFANSLTVRTSPAFHDRFIIIDQSLLLHVGASLNHIGKKCFAISVLDAANIPAVMSRIPQSP